MSGNLRKIAAACIAAAVMAPGLSQATITQFNAQLLPGNELPHVVVSPATGVATLFYDDKGTALIADDTYDFAMSVFGLTATPHAWHIHGAATTTETAPVRVGLDAAPFVSFTFGGTLLVGGNDVPVPAIIPATAPSGTNAGHPAMTFLDMLKGGLAYVNVHTPTYGPGEVRGQLVEVAAIPEPGEYALMLAGLAMVGWAVRRQRQGD